MKKFNYLFLGFLIISQLTQAAGLDDFIITVQSDNPGIGTSSDTEFIIPTIGGGYNYNVDCNDDGTDEFTDQTGDVTCDFSALGGAGTYTIRIEDNTGAGTGFPRIYFSNANDRGKITGINQWGTGQWTSMQNAFVRCNNLNDAGDAATDTPDLSAVTNMGGMFFDAASFNQDISGWNTAAVTDMGSMFHEAASFNQDISGWNTAAVTDMGSMFRGAASFNQDIGAGNWDTAAVTNMIGMFQDASAFNQDIDSWSVTSVTNMMNMFRGATAFNQNIGGWNVISVTDMRNMFLNATAFNQDIGSWNVTSVTNMQNMFLNATLSTANYDALLTGWNDQALQAGVNFHGGNSTYCLGEAARTNMINNSGWTITDAGLDASCGATGLDDFIITIQSDNPGSSSDTEFTIPTIGAGYNYNVDCNDDGTDEFTDQTGDVTCDFSALGGAGTYTIRIEDNTGAGTGFPRIFFNNGGDKDKITGINQWGTGQWTSMENAFRGCSNLNNAGGDATDEPNLSAVTNMRGMFNSATAFNQDIGGWNTSTVTDMVIMFFGATAFNQYIGDWETSAVTNMNSMFSGAIAFNQDIGGWETDAVVDMGFMFFGATAFNQYIGDWETPSVTTMGGMFWEAIAFNQDISGWNTGAVASMSFMFHSATAFNQDIGSWNVISVADMGDMFLNVTLSTANYDALLIGWSAQALQAGVNFHGGNSNYCLGETARSNMIDNDGWGITDGGLDCGAGNPSDDFVITIQSDNPGTSADTEFTIPTTGGGYNYNVDCNNDDTDEFTAQTGDVTCDFSTLGGAGTYTIRIKGNTGAGTGFPRIYFDNGGDKDKITGINQWGTGQWTSMERAFLGCSNLNDAGSAATDTPVLSAVTNMSSMFQGATTFNQNIGSWNTAAVTNMQNIFTNATAFNQNIGSWNMAAVTNMQLMFGGAISFNQDIGSWNTDAVTNMQGMFNNATAFNQDIAFNQNIGSWNTAAVTNMRVMFQGATAFNQDIGNWTTAAVTTMGLMFNRATAFNQDISEWNTAAVTNMRDVFNRATSFNQDISGWNTSAVTDMSAMFWNATAFNQNISSWNVANVTNMLGMFNNVTLSTANYDALLMGWNVQALQANVNFNGGNSNYCLGEAARSNMIDNDGWSITDAGLSCGVVNVEVELSANSSDLEGSGGNLAVILVNGTITVASTVTITDTATGTATSGDDYTDFGSPLVVNIPVGVYDGTLATAVAIPALTIIDDMVFEVDETIVLAISLPTGEAILADANADGETSLQHTYTINNDDVNAIEPAIIPSLSWISVLLLFISLIVMTGVYSRNKI